MGVTPPLARGPLLEALAHRIGRKKIAPLKSFTGGQNYVLPANVDISTFQTVTIWCESFSVNIGSAALRKQ